MEKPQLKSFYKEGIIEAGCDEAGRGCIAGPVFAAAVILPPDYKHKLLNDSKKIGVNNRYKLREEIEKEAIAWDIAYIDNKQIDEINILNASILAMQQAIEKLKTTPEHLLIDGNRFKPYKNIPHTCVIKGDSLYYSIAAASILAKTYRDDFMSQLHNEYNQYQWDKNKGYPTRAHRDAVRIHGITPYHRRSFNILAEQLKLDL